MYPIDLDIGNIVLENSWDIYLCKALYQFRCKHDYVMVSLFDGGINLPG